MVILHLTSLWESGGAADYTRNIHNNMLQDGYRSYVAVAGYSLVTPEGEEIAIKCSQVSFWNRVKRKMSKKFYEKRTPNIDSKYCGFGYNERYSDFNPKDLLAILPETPDVIIVHWVSGYANAQYVRELQKATGAKVFYIMIDEAILSGGCHYPWDCTGYKSGCKNCKMTNSRIMKIFIRWNYLYKQTYLVKEKNVIAPTEFDVIRLIECPIWNGCSIHKLIEVIDEDLFHPTDDKEVLMAKYNIPVGKKVVFFGCSNLSEIRKGMPLLLDSLNLIDREDVIYLTAGRETNINLPLNTISLGHLDMSSLAEAYQVADVFVCPSLEDSGPQMINMAIMSGVPTVAFEMGVALDIVITGVTGYRAKFKDAKDMAHGINYILDLQDEEYAIMCKTCRELALRTYSKQCQHEFFRNLFKKIEK